MYTLNIDEHINKHTRSNYLPKSEIECNFDFGYFIGAYIGNGYTDYGSGNGAIKFSNVDPYVNYKYASIVRSIFNCDVNVRVTEHEHVFDGCIRPYKIVRFDSKPMASLLYNELGHGAGKKRIPSFANLCTDEFLWGILSGLLDTDGTISTYIRKLKSKDKVRGNIAYLSLSHELVNDIAAVLDKLGLSYGITEVKDKYKLISLKECSFVSLLKNIEIVHEGKSKSRSILIEEYSARTCVEASYIGIDEHVRYTLLGRVRHVRELYTALANAKRVNRLRVDKVDKLIEMGLCIVKDGKICLTF